MAEIVLWQYRWTNPGDDTNVPPSMLEWNEVKPRNPRMQTLEQRIEELRSFRYNGKPAYEVRALAVVPDGVPALDLTQPCALTPEGAKKLGPVTECPRCKNPHHKCDNGTLGVNPVDGGQR